MKFFKLLVLSILISSSLFLLDSSSVFAATNSNAFVIPPRPATQSIDSIKKNMPTKPEPGVNTGVVVANVNISDFKINNQKNNIFRITFVLSNSKGVQSGVRYGVQLINADIKNPYIADEKVYPDSLTLTEGSKMPLAITYEAPITLTGAYNLFLVSRNEAGLGLGRVLLGKVNLKSSGEGLEISPSSCFLQVVGEKDNPHYNVLQRVDISKSETLNLTCSVVNSTKKTLIVSPFFETHESSAYGAIVKQIGGDTQSVTFNSMEKKNISVLLPLAGNSGVYQTNFKLGTSNMSSNSVSAAYEIKGISATIYNLSLDKVSYNKGDTATLSFVNVPLRVNPFLGRSKNVDSAPLNLTVKATMVNDKNQECIKSINKSFVQDVKNPKTDITANIDNDCYNPKVSVTLLDDKGNVLDQKDFSFVSKLAQATKKTSSSVVWYFILGVILVAGIALYFRNFKKK